MNIDERGAAFQCHGDWLYGVLSQPRHDASRGVLFVVGGPQYRAGSHRQFALLARHLASHGIPVLRFDYRGMGDSDGMARTFENVDDDIRAAIDYFFLQVPGLREVVLWGLCDGASAALFYARNDQRVCGLVLLNPWVRSEQGVAKAYLRHYYSRRLFDGELWRKVCRGCFDYRSAVLSLFRIARDSVFARRCQTSAASGAVSPEFAKPLPERMLQGMNGFKGKTLFVISGNDLTAKEFVDLTKSSPHWRRAMSSKTIQRYDLAAANHTFSQRLWRDQVAQWTEQWVRSW